MNNLDTFIANVKKLDNLATETAKEAAPLVQTAIRKTAAAGTTPDGVPWPKKKDGSRALEHAADHVTSVASGHTIVATLTGPDAIHNFGTEKDPKRQVIPDGGNGIPKPIADVCTEAATRVFSRTMGGGR